MPSLTSLLGSTLKDNKFVDVPTDSIEGKIIALYFSASWCGPCRGFTPKLIETYKILRDAGKAFEIVLIGSDRSSEDFDNYFKEMPWLAVPFEDRDRKTALSTTFKVHSIPTLVILDESGDVITLDGRAEVGEDPEGNRFPWRPPPLTELIGSEFTTKSGTAGKETVEGKTLALYFSAHWCPPCRAFTPRLVQTYKAIKERVGGSEVEFLFVSSDKTQEQFDEYYEQMPWAAIPFKDESRRRALGQRFGVRGIPALATVAPDGTIVNQTAKGPAKEDPKGNDFPWFPKAVEDLSVSTQSSGYNLQEVASLVVFMEDADDLEQKEVEEILLPIAEAEVKAGKQSGQLQLIFFTAKSEAHMPSQLRSLCGLQEMSGAPQMLIVDIPNNGTYHFPEGGPSTAVTADSITDFIKSYKAGSLKRQQLTRG